MPYPTPTHYSAHFSRRELDCHCGCDAPPGAEKNLAKLAHALGVDADTLLPNYSEQAIETDINPPLEIKTSSENPDMSILRINRIVKTAGIPAILEALERAK